MCWKQCKPQGACSLINKHEECMPLSYCCSVNCSYVGIFFFFALLKKQTSSRAMTFTKQIQYEKNISIHFSDVFNFRKTYNLIRSSQCCLMKEKGKFCSASNPLVYHKWHLSSHLRKNPNGSTDKAYHLKKVRPSILALNRWCWP